jgi:uncharacterized protein
MFKRRIPLSRSRLIREIFWPSMGWVRAFRYMYHRMIRLSDSSSRISLGLAIGASISFTPILGTHFIQAGIISWMCRANLLASFVGTFVGNPWTFPFMWFTAYSLGVTILGLFGFQGFGALPPIPTTGMVDFMYFLWQLVSQDFWYIFLPWFLGGYLLAIVCCPVFFVMFFYMVRGAKRARALAIKRRMKRKAKHDFTHTEHKEP